MGQVSSKLHQHPREEQEPKTVRFTVEGLKFSLKRRPEQSDSSTQHHTHAGGFSVQTDLARTLSDLELGDDHLNHFTFRQRLLQPRELREFTWFYYNKRELGEGITGDVMKVIDSHGKERAVKSTYHSSDREDKDKLREMRTELTFLRMLDHPNIARLIESFEDPSSIKIVIDICKGGNLSTPSARSRMNGNECNIALVMYQLFSAVKYMHDRRIVHRDIKQENIMFKSADPTSLHVELIDFGLSTFERLVFRHGEQELQRLSTFCGTIPYMAPEVLLASYDHQCDVWSLGVLAFELLTGHLPFQGTEKAIMKKIKHNRVDYSDSIWESLSNDARELVQNILVYSPYRWTSDMALKSTWFNVCKGMLEVSGNDTVERKLVESIKSFTRFNPLRKVTILTLAHFCAPVTIESYMSVFLKKDLDNSGTISEVELGSMLHPTTSSKEIHDMFRLLDFEESGEIPWTVMLAAMLNTDLVDDQVVLRVFDYLSKGRHTLKIEEIIDIANAANLDPDGSLLAALEEADGDHDGSLNQVEYLTLDHLPASDFHSNLLDVKPET